ncbi:hypothetical protein [Solidesulfovibrio magneticus]|uniref:hypothetical protein n=1 Tax=Solidesulfovibrio magneticus TaxID=184917 RepID=UPI0011D0B63C|nr:hypothetical protein [Solidesulfovibrio magneticus]
MHSFSLNNINPKDLFEKLFALPAGTILEISGDSLVQLMAAKKMLSAIAKSEYSCESLEDCVCIYLDAETMKVHLARGISGNLRGRFINHPLQGGDGSANL